MIDRLPKLFSVLTILVSSVGCDQITKRVAASSLKGSQPISFLGNIFRLEYAENPGAFLSLGAGLTPGQRFWLLTVMVAIFLVSLLIYLVRSTTSRIQLAGLSLILGGGVSNLLDRMFREQGRVIDFMNLGIGELRTGIFNVADVLIMVGIFLLLVLHRAQRQPHESPSK